MVLPDLNFSPPEIPEEEILEEENGIIPGGGNVDHHIEVEDGMNIDHQVQVEDGMVVHHQVEVEDGMDVEGNAGSAATGTNTPIQQLVVKHHGVGKYTPMKYCMKTTTRISISFPDHAIFNQILPASIFTKIQSSIFPSKHVH